MKHLKTLLTTIVVLLCSVTINAHDFEVDGIYYNITSSTDLTVEVTHKGSYSFSAVYSGDIEIPSSVSYSGNTYSVTSIGSNAFNSCSGLTNVSIPNSVTSIGHNAFYDSGLTNISIPNSVTSIGKYVFPDSFITTENNIQYVDAWAVGVVDKKLTTYTLRQGTIGLAGGTFENCINMQTVNMPTSLKCIGHSTFWGCCDLESVNIPANVTTIDSYAFYKCTSLSSVTIPSSVTSIGSSAFDGCTGLHEVTVNSAEFVSKDGDVNYNYPFKSAFGSQVKEYTIGGSATRIGDNALYGCDSLQTVTITAPIDSIGNYSFYGCGKLTSIEIPNSVKYIGDYAFQGCTSLSSVTIPSSVTYIGSDAFGSCTGLHEVTVNSAEFVSKDGNYNNRPFNSAFGSQVKEYTIGGNATRIGDYALYGCDSLQTVTITAPIDSIGNNSFYDCARLSSIELPNSVTYIGSSAFSNCTSLSSVTIPSSVTSIGGSVFSNCTSLSSVTIPSSVTSIGSSAFSNCTSLSSVTIPSSVTIIGGSAFSGCTGLSSVAIPSSVTSIGGSAFGRCTGLHEVTVNSAEFVSKDGNYNNRPFKSAFGSQVKEYAIGGNATRIGDYALCGCDSLQTVTITAPIDSIGNNSFYDCARLSSIELPNSVTYIGRSAFDGCAGLSSVTIPSSVTSIDDYAFSGCTSLSSVTIPSSVTSIGGSAFGRCAGLHEVTVNSAEFVSENGDYQYSYYPFKSTFGSQVKEYAIGGNATRIGDYALCGCDSLQTVTITAPIDSIGNNSFYGCGKLTSIEIPNSVKYIGSSAFDGCTSLPIEDNIRYAGNWAIGATDKTLVRYTLRSDTRGLAGTFNGCSNLARITLSDSLRYIAGRTFYACSSLKSITLPDSLAAIGEYAFYNCSTLTNMNIPANVNHIGRYAFSHCSGLTSVTLPEKLENIEAGMFEYCNKLEEVEIPVRTKSIGSAAFYNCYGLTSLSLPENLETIGNSAFYYCSKLKSLTIPENIISIGTSAFSSCYGLTSVTLCSTAIVEDGNYDDIFGTQVKEYNIGCNVSEIADYAFYNLTSLKKVSLPETIETIGEGAFENCSSLDSIALPANVATIRDYAFASCASLKYVKSDNPVPPTCGVDVFDGVETAECTLEVPDTVATVYAQTSPWDAFSIVMPEAVDRIDLIDGAVYDRVVELAVDTVTYTRNYNNTNWQALYVPFAMSYEDWAEDFEVAKINDIHQFDKNSDGDFNDDGIDKTIMEMLIVSSGNLKPNHPYMIRAKSTGEKTITVTNATLMPAQSNSIDCSSVELKYTFTGTYNVIDGTTIIENNYYFMSGGAVKYLTNPNAQLNPNRWYMQITDREGQVVQDVSEVKVVVRGEDDWDATGIDEIETAGSTFVILGIDGRMVRKVNASTIDEATIGLSTGMYVINGKKHIVK